jgi:hypothetical protein
MSIICSPKIQSKLRRHVNVTLGVILPIVCTLMLPSLQSKLRLLLSLVSELPIRNMRRFSKTGVYPLERAKLSSDVTQANDHVMFPRG